MIATKDILNRIEIDFEENASKALAILDSAILETEYLNQNRIIRCIIFLSKGNLEKLMKNIDVAIFDPRDVMMWAEYADGEFEKNLRRVRDFNNEFDKADKNVRQ